jgi:hypothetical protein
MCISYLEEAIVSKKRERLFQDAFALRDQLENLTALSDLDLYVPSLGI